MALFNRVIIVVSLLVLCAADLPNFLSVDWDNTAFAQSNYRAKYMASQRGEEWPPAEQHKTDRQSDIADSKETSKAGQGELKATAQLTKNVPKTSASIGSFSILNQALNEFTSGNSAALAKTRSLNDLANQESLPPQDIALLRQLENIEISHSSVGKTIDNFDLSEIEKTGKISKSMALQMCKQQIAEVTQNQLGDTSNLVEECANTLVAMFDSDVADLQGAIAKTEKVW